MNVNESVWQAVLDKERNGHEKLQIGESELDLEDEESEEELEDEMDDGWGDREFVSDISGDEDDLSDIEDSVSPHFDRNILP